MTKLKQRAVDASDASVDTATHIVSLLEPEAIVRELVDNFASRTVCAALKEGPEAFVAIVWDAATLDLQGGT